MTDFWNAIVAGWQLVANYLTQMPWVQWMTSLQWFFLFYFIILNLAYLVLNVVSGFSIVRHMREHRARYLPDALRAYQPPVSVILPAYNEEQSIVSSVRSLLAVDYPEFEVVIVNDGSTDKTLQTMVQAFDMVPFPEAYRKRLPTEAIQEVYASTSIPKLRMIDKANGGKADALNAALNCAHYPLFCAIDADCVLQSDSLSRVVRPFLEDARTVASGGVVRVLNGCTVKNGLLDKVDLPKGFLPGFQLVEYLRAFLFGRMGWSPFNALLIISGAFGVFYKERVIAIGGYREDTVGEDMDLVVRLHRKLREEKIPYRITFVPDPICWTEVPTDLKSLKSQRVRWQRGLAESLWPNLGLMFNRRAGVLGWLSIPFMLLFELFGPLIEFLGYIIMTVLWILGLVSLKVFLIFLLAAVGLGVLLSINAMMLEELSYHLYPKVSQRLKLMMWALLENLGYRQLTTLWRSIGLVRWMFKPRHRRWGTIQRNGSWQTPEATSTHTAPSTTPGNTAP
jgi:cellulose synthase/poly-beta-1,6-N-acetylglucosamine synthase-like glycosyltransferase